MAMPPVRTPPMQPEPVVGANAGIASAAVMPPEMPEEETPEGIPEEESTGDAQQSNVGQDEQQQYEKFVKDSAAMIYNEKNLPAILEAISIKTDPKEGLAMAIATVVMRMEDGYEQKGEKISPDVLMHGGLEVGELLAELQEAAGVADLQQEELDGVALRALDIYRENRQKQGKLNEEAIKQDFNTILEADKAGKLEEVLPGATEYAKRVQGVDAQGGGLGPKQPPSGILPAPGQPQPGLRGAQ